MAEIWGAAIAVGGAVLSAQAAKKKAKQDKKDAQETNAIATADEAKYSGILSQFNADQDYYYSQLARSNKQRGLAQYKQFSQMSKIDPSYTDTSGGIVVPTRPDIQEYKGIKEEIDPNANMPHKKGVGLSGTIGKVDPIGGKLLKGLGL